MSKILIKTEDLKQYFPISSGSKLFSKPKFLKANNGIDIEIYESETFGLVGESGCGKSTLGRVILQLYKQDRGNTIYYGRSIYEFQPKYVLKYLNNFESYRSKFIKNKENAIARNSQSKLDAAMREYRVLARLSGPLYNLSDSEFKYAKTLLLDEYKYGVAYEKSKSNEDKALLDEVRNKIVELELKQKDSENYEELKSFKDYGIDLTKLTNEEIRVMRRDIQIIFQDPYSSLNPRMTVGQIISEALIAHGMFKKNSVELEQYVVETMEKCGLEKSFIHRYPHQFSGGQRQRIGIARALALKPKFIVCDEAVSALDVSIQAQIIELLQKLKNEENLTYLFISHDLSVINNICDRIGVMYFGNMVELADNYDIFDNPQHAYTKMLLSSIPSMESRDIEVSIYDEEYSIENDSNRAKRQFTDDGIYENNNKMTLVEKGHYVALDQKKKSV